MIQVHATAVEISGLGVLLRGPSGSGKSDLALRLIEGGARLVADDYTDLAAEGGRLVARAPAAIAGRLEVRGLGIVEVPSVAASPLALAVDLVAGAEVERLPAARWCDYLGLRLPALSLAPFEASAVAKLRAAVGQAQRGRLFAA